MNLELIVTGKGQIGHLKNEFPMFENNKSREFGIEKHFSKEKTFKEGIGIKEPIYKEQVFERDFKESFINRRMKIEKDDVSFRENMDSEVVETKKKGRVSKGSIARKENEVKQQVFFMKVEQDKLAKIESLKTKLIISLVILMAMSKRPKAALDMSEAINDWIAEANAMYKAQFDNVNGYFTPVWSGLAGLNTDLIALGKLQTKAENDEKGAVKLRNSAMNQVELDLIGLLAYVQSLANAASATVAAAIIVSANMKVISYTKKPKAPLAATWGKLTGTIQLIATALGRNKAYEYQQMEDGTNIWTASGTANKARFLATGLTPLIKYWFRFRINDGNGPGKWIYCAYCICM
jgi:hypothetical protein